MPEPKTIPCPRCNGTKRYNKKPCKFCMGAGGITGPRPTFSTVTHVAERAIDIHGRVIQRCCVCGQKLIDALVKNQPADGRGKPKPIFTWAPGDLVRLAIDGPQTKEEPAKPPVLAGHFNTDALPPDFCIDMVEQG